MSVSCKSPLNRSHKQMNNLIPILVFSNKFLLRNFCLFAATKHDFIIAAIQTTYKLQITRTTNT